MSYQTMADILAANESSHERLSALLSTIPPQQWNRRPSEDRWSIEEIMEHVSLVNQGFLRITGKLLREATESGAGAAVPFEVGPILPRATAEQPLVPVKAPPQVEPTGGVPVETSLAQMKEVLDSFRKLQPQLEAIDLSRQTFSHSRLGALTAYQWMTLLHEHQDRHAGQISAVAAALAATPPPA
jgi:uncharacterized damage-inducible protein DinB